MTREYFYFIVMHCKSVINWEKQIFYNTGTNQMMCHRINSHTVCAQTHFESHDLFTASLDLQFISMFCFLGFVFFSGCTQLQSTIASPHPQPTRPVPTRLSPAPATPCSPSSRTNLSTTFPRIVSTTAREQCRRLTASSHLRQKTELHRDGLSPPCSKEETALAPATS